MTAWRDFEQAEPDFAGHVRALFAAHRHKTMATVRADGAPRISGVETGFEDGELGFGSMANAPQGARLNSSSDCWRRSSSVSAREKLAIRPWLRASRASASCCE